MGNIKMAKIQRRNFLGALGCAPIAWTQNGAPRAVSIVLDPADPVASPAPVQWAARELQQALADAGVSVSRHERVAQAGANELCIVASGPRVGLTLPNAAESLALARSTESGRPLVLASGSDVRG